MSNFTHDDLKDLLKESLESLNLLAVSAQEKGIDIDISIFSNGMLTVSSKEWDETDSKKVLNKHTIEWGKDRKSESTDIYYYDK
jgi:hypothetical protein